ncbi:4733_t:CDS:1, partial [Racocetra fulgida]
SQKVLQMAQLRATINYYHRHKEVEMSIEKYKQNNVAPPLPVIDKSTNLHDNNSISAFNETSGEMEELDNETEESDSEYESINNSNNWDEIMRHWIDMISEEDLTDDEELAKFDININVNNVEPNQNINYKDHPAINNDAKWEIQTLFKDDIPVPPFISDL